MSLIDIFAKSRVRKGLFSFIYGRLLGQDQRKAAYPGRRGWEKDLGALPDEIWEDTLKQVPMVSVSAQQSLSQLFIIHRVYRTPLKLYKWGRHDTLNCLRCSIFTALVVEMS